MEARRPFASTQPLDRRGVFEPNGVVPADSADVFIPQPPTALTGPRRDAERDQLVPPPPMNRMIRYLLALAGFGTLVLHATESSLPDLPHYERYLVIDNACGWPNLTALPNGQLALLIWPLPTHGDTEGAAECWLSGDDGKSWRKASVPVPHEPKMNRMNLAGGIAHDGGYIALISGWSNRQPPGWTAPRENEQQIRAAIKKNSKTLKPIPAISQDGGQTWKHFPAVSEPVQENGGGLIPFGRVATLPDGQLGVMMYLDHVYFMTSADQGATWQLRGTVTEKRTHNETTWLRLDNGDLFAASRTYGDEHLDAYRSTDGGRTWKNEGPLTLPRQIPADLTRLPDGRVLLSYGVRNEGSHGIHVRVGDAAARTWSAPIGLVNLEGSTNERLMTKPRRDGGYPSTVVLPGGMLVTAYYSKGIPAHHRYHVGIVRWRLPEIVKK